MGKLYQKHIENFKCMAQFCPDTCCAKWQICIDEQTASKYLADAGEIGKIAKQSMRGKIYNAHLAMLSGRCPYLTEDNLCKVIQLKGEKSLSKVCSLHPRFTHTFYEDEFTFLSLSCPSAVKVFLRQLKQGGIIYEKENLENPYLSQFYEYVCKICEQFMQTQSIEKLIPKPVLPDFINLILRVFCEMEYLEKDTKTAIEKISAKSVENGFSRIKSEYGEQVFSQLFKYFSLVLYDERTPVLATAFIFAFAIFAVAESFESVEQAIYKFVKEVEHSQKNIRRAIRIMRSKKAQITMQNIPLFSALYHS